MRFQPRRQFVSGLAGLAASSSTLHAEPLFRPTELNHLTLYVSNLERSQAFYGKLFGQPEWNVPPSDLALDLGANPLGIYLVARPDSIGINHFCVAVQGFNVDNAVSRLKRRSIDARTAANGVGVQFTDPDRVTAELVPPNYRNPQAKPRAPPQPPQQPLF